MRRLVLRCIVALGVVVPSLASAQEKCRAAAEVAKLPAVSALLDSATLIKNLPAPEMAASKEVIVRVTTTPAARAVVLDSVVAKTESGRVLAEKVVASLKADAKNVLAAFRLRILLGEAPTVAVLPAEACPTSGKP